MRTPLLAATLAVVGWARGTAAQAVTITGVVRDSASGRPVAPAVVREWRSGLEARVDAGGRYVLAGLPPGDYRLRVTCDTAAGLKRWWDGPRSYGGRGARQTLAVRIDAAACAPPAFAERRGEFRGHYAGGFEASRFAACGDTLPLAWADFPAGAWDPWRDRLARRPARRGAPADAPDEVYLRVRGVLRGPGHYGHFGMAAYQLQVDTVLDARRARRGDCR